MNPIELPELQNDIAERSSQRLRVRDNAAPTTLSITTLVIGALVVVLLGAAISGAFTLAGKEQLRQWMGIKPVAPQPDPTAIAVQALGAQLAQLSQLLDNVKHMQLGLSTQANNLGTDLDKLSLRVTNIERFASNLEQKMAAQKKAQPIQVGAQPKKITPTQPKAPAIIPLVLTSIRYQAGTPLVGVRDGLDQSELLMPGDSWRGWTLLDADPATRRARFKVAGTEQELRL